MAEIVVCEFMDEEIARDGFKGRDLLFDPALVDAPERLAASVEDAKALVVRNRTQVRGALLERAAALTVVGRLGVGLDNIDLKACEARGIEVCPASGANDLSVAEYVVTAAMVLRRGAWVSTDAVISGAWPRNRLIGRELSGATLGLVGFGAIARETAARAAALGVSVIAYDPYLPADDPRWNGVKNASFGEVLENADIVSLHTPLTDETRHLIGEDAFRVMKSDAVLVNAARGGIVDEAALASALREGRLGGAALDVFEAEPLTAEAGEKFKGLANLILTPHIAGVTAESNVRVSKVTVENVLRVLDA